jgi:endoglucanase
MSGFLKVNEAKIVCSNGKPVFLKGVNLGGWLLMEGYFMHAPNQGVQAFKKDFSRELGARVLKQFEEKFRDHFIQEEDFKRIARFGFNCVRIPFHHRLIEKRPYEYCKEGLAYLDRAIRWAKKYHLYVILDLHAAAGCQNHDWHSDSLGQARLWTNRRFQKRTVALWALLADRYKEETAVAGYDLLNEAVIKDAKKLNQFYQEMIDAIRRVDPYHILFVEGNLWATDLACLQTFDDKNLVLSIHFYHPIDFVFNFVPQLSYPLRYQGVRWSKAHIKRSLQVYQRVARKQGAPIFVGEFGVNARENVYGEADWLRDVLSCFNEQNFHWTYWTYKAVKNAMFPDGMYSYRENPAWVNRQGPKTGWETYAKLWPVYGDQMVASWGTEHFKPNQHILSVLKHAI